jgi:L-arabinose isomerase
MRAACAWADSQRLKLCRFGDNMREVAVTEGDKVAAQEQFGYAVNGYGVGDLVARIARATDAEVDRLVGEYSKLYEVKATKDQMGAVRGQARIELGLRAFLEEGGFAAFTDTFEDLHGLEQLPGLAVQRLMAEGYGFGAEGDWKTAALVRALKVMATGLPAGTSFMEDYTYHLAESGDLSLGAHMLEVCESIAAARPSLEIHPLSIGGKADPVRLIFDAHPGRAVIAGITDMGQRFRMLASVVDVVAPPHSLPRLPVARSLWRPRPDLKTNAAAWIHAGGSHHTSLGFAVTPEHLTDFAAMSGTEFLLIDETTQLDRFRDQLRWNDLYYLLARAL